MPDHHNSGVHRIGGRSILNFQEEGGFCLFWPGLGCAQANPCKYPHTLQTITSASSYLLNLDNSFGLNFEWGGSTSGGFGGLPPSSGMFPGNSILSGSTTLNNVFGLVTLFCGGWDVTTVDFTIDVTASSGPFSITQSATFVFNVGLSCALCDEN